MQIVGLYFLNCIHHLPKFCYVDGELYKKIDKMVTFRPISRFKCDSRNSIFFFGIDPLLLCHTFCQSPSPPQVCDILFEWSLHVPRAKMTCTWKKNVENGLEESLIIMSMWQRLIPRTTQKTNLNLSNMYMTLFILFIPMLLSEEILTDILRTQSMIFFC